MAREILILMQEWVKMSMSLLEEMFWKIKFEGHVDEGEASNTSCRWSQTFKDVRFIVQRAMLLDLVMEIDVPLYFFSKLAECFPFFSHFSR